MSNKVIYINIMQCYMDFYWNVFLKKLVKIIIVIYLSLKMSTKNDEILQITYKVFKKNDEIKTKNFIMMKGRIIDE